MRCFVAIELSEEAREAAARAQAALRRAAPRADVRWADAAGFHVTVKFLGRVEDVRVPEVVAALEAVTADAVPLALATGGLGAFPTPRRARVVWLGLSDATGDAARLAGAVDLALAPLGFVPEARSFHPHVTLGRVRSPRGLGALAAALAAVRPPPAVAWTAGALVLFQSHLRPTGSVYEAVARPPLRGPETSK